MLEAVFTRHRSCPNLFTNVMARAKSCSQTSSLLFKVVPIRHHSCLKLSPHVVAHTRSCSKMLSRLFKVVSIRHQSRLKLSQQAVVHTWSLTINVGYGWESLCQPPVEAVNLSKRIEVIRPAVGEMPFYAELDYSLAVIRLRW